MEKKWQLWPKYITNQIFQWFYYLIYILEDEEPNILTNKTCLPNKMQGFSHLEWSASIPYNMAEEPDDVQGR